MGARVGSGSNAQSTRQLQLDRGTLAAVGPLLLFGIPLGLETSSEVYTLSLYLQLEFYVGSSYIRSNVGT